VYDDNKNIEQEIKNENRSGRESFRPKPLSGGEIVLTFGLALAAITLILGTLYGVYHWLL
jgi:hypothetical protein